MADDEIELIDQAAKELRKKERSIRKKTGFDGGLNYFDSDDLSLLMHNMVARLKRDDGTEILLTPISGFSEDDKFVITPEDVICFSFMPKDHIETILNTNKALGPIRHRQVDFSMPGHDSMKDYCCKLTEEITETVKELKNKRIDSVIRKLYSALGGNPPNGIKDYLVQRVRYFRDVADKFYEDKVIWRKFMVDLGLLKK